MKACFPRSARLISPKDYSRVFNRAQKSVDDYFTVLYRVNDLNQARLGLAIAKKNLKRAVDRNQVKRVVRESFRSHQPELEGLDIVVLSRKGIPAGDKPLLHASLEKHWARLAKYMANP
ncbi:MAG: ribonuclease P protein component [Sedimenticola sp.]|nr:MAG: ribonuclease P protein component [Sedimenticola sp.]